MDEEIERLVVSVRADTAAFAGDVAIMRDAFEGGLGGAAHRTGDLIETALLRGIRTGKLGFDDLKRVALSAMAPMRRETRRGTMRSVTGDMFPLGRGCPCVRSAVRAGISQVCRGC